MRRQALLLRGRARSGESLDKMLPEAFRPGLRGLLAASASGAVRRAAGGRRRPASGRPGGSGHRRRQDAGRHFAGRPQRPGRQGRPRHHGQRLPGPPRQRMDRPRSCRPGPERRHAAQQGVRRGAGHGLQGGHHLRHLLGVRLRFPARPAQGQEPGHAGSAVLGSRGLRREPMSQPPDPKGPARPSLRSRRRGGQHLRRRGPHAAHHRRADRGWPRKRNRSSIAGPINWPAPWSATSISTSTKRSTRSS